jgi:hypothetical protein
VRGLGEVRWGLGFGERGEEERGGRGDGGREKEYFCGCRKMLLVGFRAWVSGLRFWVC